MMRGERQDFLFDEGLAGEWRRKVLQWPIRGYIIEKSVPFYSGRNVLTKSIIPIHPVTLAF